MNQERKNLNLKNGTTPLGEVIWADLTVPDKKFNQDGEYKVIFRVSADKAQPLISEIEEIIKTEIGLNKKTDKISSYSVYHEELNKDGSSTGNIVFKFKSDASGRTPDGRDWTRSIPIFDKAGFQVVDPGLLIGAGSKLIVSYDFVGYTSPIIGIGCKARLLAVQLIKHVPPKGRKTAKDFGFNVQEYDDSDYVFEETNLN